MSKADGLKEVASALAYQRTVGANNHLEELERENAELKALIKSEHEIEARKNNMLISQLTKAKEIISKYYNYTSPSSEYFYSDINEEAKAFLESTEDDNRSRI